jgi:hypothetical protein
MPNTYHLVKVHGRMGVAIYDDDSMTVWVPDGENWSCWYVMEAHKPRPYEKWMIRREHARPHLVHGDYFLTLILERLNPNMVLCRHTVSKGARFQDSVVRIRDRMKAR